MVYDLNVYRAHQSVSKILPVKSLMNSNCDLDEFVTHHRRQFRFYALASVDVHGFIRLRMHVYVCVCVCVFLVIVSCMYSLVDM
jgi:hypothetical protein